MERRPEPDFAVSSEATEVVTALKTSPGKDIWLFGGGTLFRHLLDARLVDTIEVSVMPILLSQGIPLLPAGQRSPRLRFAGSKARPSGVASLTYALDYSG
jgi:dihydrofolate reductase